VKEQVLLVVSLVVFAFQRDPQGGVQPFHFLEVRGLDVVEDGQNSRRLQGADDFVTAANLFDRQAVHKHAAAGGYGDEPLGVQLQERIPQRGLADAQFLTDLVQVDRHPGGQFPPG